MYRSVMARKLHYYNLNGLAESLRYILHYSNKEFEDIRYEKKTWPVKSVKNSFPYGQFPVYEEGDRKLNQSIAIAKYLAIEAKLLPKDPWEQALLDAAALNIYDFWAKVVQFIVEKEPSRKAFLKQHILVSQIDYFFSRFEKELKANQGFFNGKLSWVDFILVGIVEACNLILEVEIDKKYPTVRALGEKIRSLPGVKEYVAAREPYVF